MSFKKEINPSDALESMLKNTEQDGRFTTYLEKVVPYYGSANLNTNKNYIIFVNGFLAGLSNTKNEIHTSDFENSYWEGLDALFMARRNAKNCFYASGNMPILTSGHTPFIDCSGFTKRQDAGRIAGSNFVNLLKSRDISDAITLDVVCHSMGFAYAQGMIEVIKASGLPIRLRGYYIIAPDTPSCGSVNASDFEQVWHYGANENNENFSDRDGIATQAPIQGLEQYRTFTPQEAETGFYDRHAISYFKWIFKRQADEKGYVTPQK